MPRPTDRELDLEALLSPMSPQTFVGEHFERRPVHIRGPSRKFAGLIDRAGLEALLRSDAELPALQVSITGKDGVESVLMGIEPKHAMKLFAAGATICVTGVDSFFPNLRRLATRIKTQLNYFGAVDLRAYYSPDGSGFGVHFDARVAMTLQVSGRKRWRFSPEPAVEFPRANATVERKNGKLAVAYAAKRPWEPIRMPDERTFIEVELRPGDVLCLPPGTWHTASAIGHSLALNLAFDYNESPLVEKPMPVFRLLEIALMPKLGLQAAWRRPPPAVPWTDEGRGEVPPAVRAYVEAGLGQLRAALDRLDPGGPEVGHAWRLHVCAAQGDLEVAPDREVKPVRRTDVLLTPGPGQLKYGRAVSADGDPSVWIYCASPRIKGEYGVEALPFVRQLARRRRFRAAEAMTWGGRTQRYSWAAVKSVLEDFLAIGVLKRASSASRGRR